MFIIAFVINIDVITVFTATTNIIIRFLLASLAIISLFMRL